MKEKKKKLLKKKIKKKNLEMRENKMKILPTRLWRLIEFLFNNLVWGKTKSELAASGGGAKCIFAESKSVKARRPVVSFMGSVKSSTSLWWAPTKRWKNLSFYWSNQTLIKIIKINSWDILGSGYKGLGDDSENVLWLGCEYKMHDSEQWWIIIILYERWLL